MLHQNKEPLWDPERKRVASATCSCMHFLVPLPDCQIKTVALLPLIVLPDITAVLLDCYKERFV